MGRRIRWELYIMGTMHNIWRWGELIGFGHRGNSSSDLHQQERGDRYDDGSIVHDSHSLFYPPTVDGLLTSCTHPSLSVILPVRGLTCGHSILSFLDA